MDKKATTEECLSIDVRSWRRDGWLERGTAFTTVWQRPYGRDSSIGVRVLGATGNRAAAGGAEHAAAVWLHYSWGPEGRQEEVSYPVRLSWTPCNLGGFRPWFVCPGASCGRRAAILYGPGRHFLCRQCYDLTYESRRESKKHTALRKCQRIRRKLGGSANMTKPFPKKPKGMHYDRYWCLFWEHERAHEEYIKGMWADLEKLTGRMSRLSS